MFHQQFIPKTISFKNRFSIKKRTIVSNVVLHLKKVHLREKGLLIVIILSFDD